MDAKVHVEIEGADEFEMNLKRVGNNLSKDGAKKILTAGANVIVKHAKANVRNTFSRHQTGKLENSIMVEDKGDDAAIYVTVNRIYARIQERGGTIVPKKAGGFLVWRDPDSGKLIFARKVTIPARPYFEPAIKDNTGEIVRAMETESEKEIRK